MATNRQLVASTRKNLKNAEVKATATDKTYLRIALPSFDKDGKIDVRNMDLQNVFIEGKTQEAGDILNGTHLFGLRFYEMKADGTTKRDEPFFRWELLEEVDIAAEREESLFKAKLASMKATNAPAKLATAETEVTDKW